MSTLRAVQATAVLLALMAVGCGGPVDETSTAQKSEQPVVEQPVTTDPGMPTEPPAATKDEREGKPPPALKGEKWLNTANGKPLSWQDLKGKVVLLDLWAFW